LGDLGGSMVWRLSVVSVLNLDDRSVSETRQFWGQVSFSKPLLKPGKSVDLDQSPIQPRFPPSFC